MTSAVLHEPPSETSGTSATNLRCAGRDVHPLQAHRRRRIRQRARRAPETDSAARSVPVSFSRASGEPSFLIQTRLAPSAPIATQASVSPSAESASDCGSPTRTENRIIPSRPACIAGDPCSHQKHRTQHDGGAGRKREAETQAPPTARETGRAVSAGDERDLAQLEQRVADISQPRPWIFHPGTGAAGAARPLRSPPAAPPSRARAR